LFAMMAPIAPAFCAFLTLTTKPQVPRSARTICPVAFGSASQASVVVPTPSFARTMVAVTPVALSGGPKIAPCAG
jgi:hypothetical protein